MRALIATVSFLVVACAGDGPFAGAQVLELKARPRDGLQWYRGNTHTHTLNSDGDSPPMVVAEWYKNHGYHFLILSDHNVFTDPLTLAAVMDSSFLLIGGEEITVGVEGVPVHVNGIGINRLVQWQRRATQLETIQTNADVVRRLGGIAQINHPNLEPGLDIASLERVRNVRLLEIHNAISVTNNAGWPGRPSATQIWDRLLTVGQEIYGVASDDAHYLDYFHPLRANPGRAWIVVRATSLTQDAILEAMNAGNFYASTGVELVDILIEPNRLTVDIRQEPEHTYVTRFIGLGGNVLAETSTSPAIYELVGDERYVRAEIMASDGAMAWVQPAFRLPR